jgi:Ca2+:H+ antiporter
MALHSATNPIWTVIAPVAGAAVVAALFANFFTATPVAVAIALAALLAACVFAAVHHAEIIAAKTGEPMGSIVLALAVTVLELGLILSLMLAAGDKGATIARDTVYSAFMIITTGILGLCLLFGSRRHFEQSISVSGTASTLAVLAVLAVITLILPNYTLTTRGPTFSNIQLLLVAITSLVLYASFLFVQTVRHRDYFLPEGDGDNHHNTPTATTFWVSLLLLALALAAVILLSKTLSPNLNAVIAGAGLPASFTGVIVAAIILLPEGIAALRAALANRLQTSLNLALGSGLATIGLTIPAVAFADLLGGFNIALGISETQTVLLLLALFVNAVTLSNGRTNILLGVVHLSVFAMFLLISAVP